MIPDMSLGSERPTRWMARVLMLAVIAGISFVFPVLGFAQDTTDYPYDYAADTDPAALDDFAEPLDPYGTWVDHPTYGTVWVPDRVVVGDDFQPYRTAGKWAVADDGEWVWISDYDWGYIPFHYGRWVWISGTGWAWIPGRVYAPAWVVWRTGEPGYDYIGWAPAPPAYVWFGGVAVGYYGTVTVPWWYCPSTYFFSPFWHYHVLHHHHHIHRVHAHTHHYHGHHGHHGPHRKAATNPAVAGPMVMPRQPAPKRRRRDGVTATLAGVSSSGRLRAMAPRVTPSMGSPSLHRSKMRGCPRAPSRTSASSTINGRCRCASRSRPRRPDVA